MYDFLALSNCVSCDGVFVFIFLKQLLDSVFVISGISASVFGSAGTTYLIIAEITKTSSDNFLLFVLRMRVLWAQCSGLVKKVQYYNRLSLRF